VTAAPHPEPMDLSIDFVNLYLRHAIGQASAADVAKQLTRLSTEVLHNPPMEAAVLSDLARIALSALLMAAEGQGRSVDQVWAEVAQSIRSGAPHSR
jgi:hypothetical protein